MLSLDGMTAPVCAYVYDTAVLRDRAARLRAQLPGVTVLYAMKANGHPSVVRTLAEACDGLEVASGGELALAQEVLGAPASAGPAPVGGRRRIVFGGPGKTASELAAAISAGATVNVESETELRRLSALAEAVGATVDIGLRVNRAGVHLDGSHRMTGVPTPFGVDEAQLGSLVALAKTLPGVRLLGWHLHAVSDNLDAVAHTAFAQEALAWSVETAGRLGVRLRYVNLGGGLGVDYVGDREFDLASLRITPPEGVEVVLEPGRWLVNDAGWYAVEVLDLKRNHGRWFAVVRGGTHHFRLPAAWGYHHPFTVVPMDEWPYSWPRPQVSGLEVDAVGELCTPRDVLCRSQYVDRIRVGDVLVFARVGGYGWDISHHRFLKHPEPQFLIR